MGRLFGTDGIRGLANRDVTAELALNVGTAAARVLAASGQFQGHLPRAVVGRDTRVSGEFLSGAICAGLASAGVDVLNIGVLPTPAVAFLTATSNVDLGVVLSASHNGMPDNGIKIFARGGLKLADSVEDQIESVLDEHWERPIGADVGRIVTDNGSAADAYIEHVISSIGADSDTFPLAGMRIAVDCANGAASVVGPEALRQAGADVVVINASPDGRNINEKCGSTHPEQLQAVVVASEAQFGVAFDGDADRCLAVDHTGALIDGDQIMGILAIDMQEKGLLHDDTLVVTVMSNLGLLLAMRDAGITTHQAGVGDRYVLEAMHAGGFSLGGEQSGHVVISEYATTGDGILSALKLAARISESGQSMAALAAKITKLPQILVNVPGVDKPRAATDEQVLAAVAAAKTQLGDHGRVLLRASGTEDVVRVMVESATQEEADSVAHHLADVVRERCAL